MNTQFADALGALRVSTPRLELRLPTSDEWQAFAEAVAGRVVAPESAHFVGAWAQLASPRFEEAFVGARQRTLRSYTPRRWGIELGAFAGDGLVGQTSLYADDCPSTLEVVTASLLLPDMRGRGLGTEMRAGILALAFTALGAKVAWSGATLDNSASNRVSEKLGYEKVGHQTRPTGAGDAVFTRQRLTAAAFTAETGIRVAGSDRLAALLERHP